MNTGHRIKHKNNLEDNLQCLNICLEIIKAKIDLVNIGFCQWYSYQAVESKVFGDIEESHKDTYCIFLTLVSENNYWFFSLVFHFCQMVRVK